MTLSTLNFANFANPNAKAFLLNEMGIWPSGPRVNIYVGSKRKYYQIHQRFLSETSRFFKSILKHDFKEKSDNEISLSEEDPAVFDRFVRWAQYRKMMVSTPCNSNTCKRTLELYVMADKFCAEELKNEAVDEVRKYYETCKAEISHLRYIMDNTPSSSNETRRLLVKSLAFDIATIGLYTMKEWDKELEDVLKDDGELTFEVLDAVAEQYWGGLKDPAKIAGCFCHEHKDTPKCR